MYAAVLGRSRGQAQSGGGRHQDLIQAPLPTTAGRAAAPFNTTNDRSVAADGRSSCRSSLSASKNRFATGTDPVVAALASTTASDGRRSVYRRTQPQDLAAARPPAASLARGSCAALRPTGPPRPVTRFSAGCAAPAPAADRVTMYPTEHVFEAVPGMDCSGYGCRGVRRRRDGRACSLDPGCPLAAACGAGASAAATRPSGRTR